MLWCLVVPCSILILMLSLLVGSYSSVVWRSDQVSYEGSLGKFSAKVSDLQKQLDSALIANEKLTETVALLKKSLEDINVVLKPSSQVKYSAEKTNLIFDKLPGFFNSLNEQEILLNKQKGELKALSNDMFQFKQELNVQSKKYNQSQ